MNSDAPVSSVFSRPRSDAPWWVLPILTFLGGCFFTAGVLMPTVNGPEYERGFKAATEAMNEQMQLSVKDAKRVGREEALRELGLLK